LSVVIALAIASANARPAWSQPAPAEAAPTAELPAPTLPPPPAPPPDGAPVSAPEPEPEPSYSVAGSIQLDYLGVPTDGEAATHVFDGATAEVSLRVTKELGEHATAVVKVCFACHGFEAAMGYVELRASDALRFRIGRLTPALGSFPQRHDPANHATSDKPLPYDMGRMLHGTAWNEGILPAPWVDNGIEVAGTRFWDRGRVDYALWAVSGPKSGPDASDIDFTLSRSPQRYYVDNNSQPALGGRLLVTLDTSGNTALALGLSAMAGTYDPDRDLRFALAGADVMLTTAYVLLRAEYLLRRTELALGADPATRFRFGPGADGTYADYFVKDGFYAEAEAPLGDLSLVARFDGLRRRGNVVIANPLDASSTLLRHTVAVAYRLLPGVQLKTSAELYQSSELGTDLALHLGVVSAF